MKEIVNKVCNQQLMSTNGGAVPFQHAKVPTWTNTIVENVLKELAVVNSEAAKNGQQKYKFVVTVNLQQKTGAGMVTAAATYGDPSLDRNATVKYETEHVQLQVVVYGMAV